MTHIMSGPRCHITLSQQAGRVWRDRECVCTREPETETITESERNSTYHAGIHSHSVCLSPDSQRLSEEQQRLPAGSACISQTRSFHQWVGTRNAQDGSETNILRLH